MTSIDYPTYHLPPYNMEGLKETYLLNGPIDAEDKKVYLRYIFYFLLVLPRFFPKALLPIISSTDLRLNCAGTVSGVVLLISK